MATVTDALRAPAERLAEKGYASWRTPESPVRRIAEATGMWAASRFAVFLAGYVALLFYGQHGSPDASNPVLGLHQYLAHWMQWDTLWYLMIAQYGYGYINRAAFYPLYPMLIRFGAFLFGPHQLLIALLISFLAALPLFIGLGELARLCNVNGRRAMLLLCAGPVAFFLSAAYTEATFMAFAVWALVAMRRGWWYRASAFVFIATLTRVTGVALLLPLIYEFANQQGWIQALWQRQPWRTFVPTRKQLAQGAAVVLSAPLAVALFFAWCWHVTGNAFASLTVVHTYWGRTRMALWQSLPGVYARLAAAPRESYWQARLLLDVLALAVVVGVTLIAARRQPLSFTLFSLGIVVLTVTEPAVLSNSVIWYDSAARYMIAAIPVVLSLAQWSERRPWLETLLISGGFMLQTVLLTAFLTGGWVV